MSRGAAALALALTPVVALAYPDGAPPAHTHAYGEPGCVACHFDAEPQPAGARVQLIGLPEAAAASARYRLVLILDGDPAAAGFQLTARTADGRQAGSLEPADASTRVVAADGVLYLGHARADASRWTFWWRAPAASDTVHFHVSLNSANGDRSEFGDELLVFEALTRMEASR